MEVRIKQGEEMIDATIEMVDGVMVVSPKEVKFEPKDGDVVFSGVSLISIFKKRSLLSFCAYIALNSDDYTIYGDSEYWSKDNLRPATEEEKKLLFDRLAEEGLAWDSEKREIVQLKWKPKAEEHYFKPKLDMGQFILHQTRWLNDVADRTYYKKGWIFKEQIDCENFCLKLNDAISQVKP